MGSEIYVFRVWAKSAGMPTVTPAMTIEEPINARFSSNAAVTFARLLEAAVRTVRRLFVARFIARKLTPVLRHVLFEMQGEIPISQPGVELHPTPGAVQQVLKIPTCRKAPDLPCAPFYVSPRSNYIIPPMPKSRFYSPPPGVRIPNHTRGVARQPHPANAAPRLNASAEPQATGDIPFE